VAVQLYHQLAKTWSTRRQKALAQRRTRANTAQSTATFKKLQGAGVSSAQGKILSTQVETQDCQGLQRHPAVAFKAQRACTKDPVQQVLPPCCSRNVSYVVPHGVDDDAGLRNFTAANFKMMFFSAQSTDSRASKAHPY